MRPADAGRAGLLLLTAASAVFGVWLLLLARRQWFVTDEFGYFAPDGESVIGWLLRPHNEHTIAFTKAWFGLLLPTVGLRAYVLYAVPLVVSHLIVVAAIYRLTWISTTSRLIAGGTALLSLTMGGSAGTLTWAGQLQYTGSVAAGLIAILLAVDRPIRREFVVLTAIAVVGTLNGTAFVPFALAASITYLLRRRWAAAVVVSAIPLAWQVVVRVVWAPSDPFAATSLEQILRDGPAFAYSVLDAAISQTLAESHLSAALLVAMGIGTLAVVSAAGSRRTPLAERVATALAVATVLSMLVLIAGRLGRGVEQASAGGYSYLFLATLLPLAGLLLGHVSRSRAAVVGSTGLLLVLSLIGVAVFARSAIALSGWRLSGERLMETAAASLDDGLSTYSDQMPVPDTAPTVTQSQLRSWAMRGWLNAVDMGSVESDQVSLNLQWRTAVAADLVGTCRDVAAGSTFAIRYNSPIFVLALQPGSTFELQYPNSEAKRRLDVPNTPAAIQTLAQRDAVATAETGSIRVCE
jgi:hypothetical protein